MNSLLQNSDLKKVGKTTRPFRYDLTQIPYNYPVEVTDRFKGLDLIECLKNNKLWKILKEMGIPDYLTCLLRNLYASQEATVRTVAGTDSFQIGKGVCQGCILLPCLFNLYTEYIIWNAELDDSQAEIRIARRNINKGYADDTTLMAESKEELKSLLVKVKEENEKAGLKLNIQEMKIIASGPITSLEIDGKKWKQW